ncbi:hypothetical protein NPIL_687801 [Nephila pilipes]|uniref:Uncharacterized protein n=1 Tax=Nephila pilipes TaxID=299642 RepID=A0A8X6MY06_NEPPI|nr:hypothetical protein NPIL_687801 [Nephila pilipes]
MQEYPRVYRTTQLTIQRAGNLAENLIRDLLSKLGFRNCCSDEIWPSSQPKSYCFSFKVNVPIAAWLDKSSDVISHSWNYLAVILESTISNH